MKISVLLIKSYLCPVNLNSFARNKKEKNENWFELDEQVLNKISCFQANGSKDDPVDVQHTIPDVSTFQVCGK